MADSCWVNLWCRPKDRKIFEELGFRSEFEKDEFRGMALHMISDYYIDVTGVKGTPFVIEAGSTYEASPSAIANDGENWMEGECNEQGVVVVEVEVEGDAVLDQEKVNRALDFVRFRNKVLRLMGAVK